MADTKSHRVGGYKQIKTEVVVHDIGIFGRHTGSLPYTVVARFALVRFGALVGRFNHSFLVSSQNSLHTGVSGD